MKKRILALALAGTTAFSVFGAAVTADAAYSTAGSAQVVSTNDIYKHYTPVAGQIDTNYTGATASTVVYYRWKEDSKSYEKINGVTNDTELRAYLSKFNNIKENFSRYTKITDKNGNTYYVASADDVLNYQGGKQEGGIAAFGVTAVEPGTGDWGVANSKYNYDGKVYDSLSALIDALDGDKTEYGYKNKNSDTFKDGNAYDAMAYDTIDQYAKANVITKSADDSKPGSATITITADKAGTYDWYFDASTNSDTTIYPWTVSTKYVTDKNGYKVAVNEAVSNPTVYLFDFIPANSTVASASDIAYYYNNASDKNDYLQKAAGLITNGAANAEWKAETGRGSSYGIRREVVEEYENFLYELQLIGNDRYDYVITNPNVFKDQYTDLYVSGNYYDPYTGQVIGTWKSDVYNLEEMFDDIWNSRNAYESMNTSEMLYLMQQYDKYVGNYVDKEEVDKDAWGDLLVSILESVTEDDFTKATYYKQFSRAAEDAIDNYEDAVSSAQIRDAEQEMYGLIVSKNYKTTSSADAKAELNSSIASLYFNAKTAAAEYETAGNIRGNAALTDYAYIAAVTTVADPLYSNDITLTQTATTTTGHYALYPASDYYQYGNKAAQFPGNDIRSTKTATENVTDEYEWFLNVYELATSAATSANVPSMMSAVSDALDEAVAALEVTNTATATAQSALEEMIKHHEGKLDMYVTGNGVNKEDFAEKYYNAYEAALAYADTAEGAAQVANARRMVAVAADALTYQGAQVTVTKNDIKTLQTSIKEGEAALKAIKGDKNYNAAQVNALNKALGTANEIVAIWNGTTPSYNKVNHATVGYIGDKDAIVKSDITGAIEGIDAAINYSEVIMGWSKNEAGKWMYGTEEGYLSNGWNKIDKTWFYFNEDGTAKQSEWMNDNGTWYWFNSNCGAATGWAKVDGSWYFFKGNNAMKTGWEKVDGNWYYLASSGKMVTGWCEIGGKWYYFSKESNSLGQMLCNTTVDGYKLDANGVWAK